MATLPGVPARLTRAWRAIGDLWYGLTGYEFARQAAAMRAELDALFMLLVFGDLLGVPVLPPVSRLRLLSYALPEIAAWKRRVAREKELWERGEYDLRGV